VIEHQLELLAGQFDSPITIVTNRPSDYEGYGGGNLRCIPDLDLPECEPDRSPMRGLLSAMRDSAEPWVLAVACDSPWPDPDTLAALFEKSIYPRPSTCPVPSGLCFADDHGIQPMPGFYNIDLADGLESRLRSNQRGLRKWIETTPGIAVHGASDLNLTEAAVQRVVSGFNTWNSEAKR